MSEEIKTTQIVGTPTMVLFPARDHNIKVHDKLYKIIIPRKGRYCDIDPEFFKEEDGEFNLLDDSALYLPSITKVLFATKKYPDLEDNHFFVPVVLVFNEDEVEIVGQVVEIVIS